MFISLTLTPMMCARLLKPDKELKHGRLYNWSEVQFQRINTLYERGLKVCLRHDALTLLVLLLTIATTVGLLIIVPKGFFPEQDNGTIQGGVQGQQDISFQAMDRTTRAAVDIIKADPAVEHVMAFTGGSGATNGGSIFIGLKPLQARKLNATQVIARLRPKLGKLPGASVFLQAGQDLRIGGRQSNAQYQYTIQTDDPEVLSVWGEKLLAQMKTLPGLLDTNTDQQNGGLKEQLTYDRQSAARLGLTPQLIDQTLYDEFGQSLASTLYTSLNQYYVVMEVAPQFWQSPAGLESVYLHGANNTVVPLASVAKYAPVATLLAVNHNSQLPSATISFNLAPGVALSDASKLIEQHQVSMGMPSTIRGLFSGTLEAFKASLATQPILIITALLAVYIVLGILYESYVHPVTILSTIPSASVGAVLALMLFGLDLSVVALIGIVLLIGIVKKNAILIIDFALAAERDEGKSSEAAILEACLLRFRPILMTTLAALFGAVPLAFGTGTGSELRRPLGIAIIGGLIFSQVQTLFTTPVVYLYLDRLRLRRLGKRRDRVPALQGAEHES